MVLLNPAYGQAQGPSPGSDSAPTMPAKDQSSPPSGPQTPNGAPPPSPSVVKPDWQSSVNYWLETNGRNTFLNEYFFSAAHGNLDIIAEYLVVPGKSFERLRVHWGDFYLHQSDDAVVLFRPGVIADTTGDVYVGVRLSITFPKLDLSIVHDGYGGNRIDRHESFVEFKPLDNLGLTYYQFADRGDIPKALLGPHLYIADTVNIYYGMPTNSNRRTLLWVSGNFSF